MHEFSLINDLIQKIKSIADNEKATKVRSVKVTLGALSHISPDHFKEHFVQAARHTVAEGAALEVEEKKDLNDPHAQEIILESVQIEEDQ